MGVDTSPWVEEEGIGSDNDEEDTVQDMHTEEGEGVDLDEKEKGSVGDEDKNEDSGGS